MNAQIATLQPLSAALQSPAWVNPGRPTRRHLVGGVRLQAEALLHFNQLLARLNHFPLDRDQLATASRDLTRSPAEQARAQAITQRLRLAGTIDRMASDAAWGAAEAAVGAARMVIDYVRGHHALIPTGLPQIGRFDDAILIDAAWPQLADEVTDYLDYCRLRATEAELRGCDIAGFAFSRDDWQQARLAEVGLRADRRRAVTGRYLPISSAACFHVH
ncbi:hypothetical protein [Rhodanobacter lindaniclasticus]